MLPFLPNELGNDFDLDHVLRWGAIPLIWNAENKDEVLKDYVQSYLKQEIQAEAIVRNLAGFARSLPVMALFNGQVMNVAAMARDAGIERKTAEGYASVLEDTLLAKKLYPYRAKVTVREKKKPKLYWVDPGIARAAKSTYGDVTPEEKGALFESYIFQIIRHQIENEKRYQDVFYWAPAQGSIEVDFLLQQGREFVGIEAKSSKRIRPEHLKGLLTLNEHLQLRRKIVVFAGQEFQKTTDGVEIMPIQLFAEKIAEGL